MGEMVCVVPFNRPAAKIEFEFMCTIHPTKGKVEWSDQETKETALDRLENELKTFICEKFQ